MNFLIGIRKSHFRNQAAAELCLWPHGHWDRQETGISGKGFFALTVGFKCVPRCLYSEALAQLLKNL
jgi:hypothetical protein